MINYKLPKEAEIDGKKYKIREQGDYRQILDVIEILKDRELTEEDRTFNSLLYFYEECPPIEKAVEYMQWFIACGKPEETNKPLIMDWEKDFNYIASGINKQGGEDIRAVQYMHWWTFISKYMEIGESVFSTIISIRQKLQKGEKLEKWEQKFYIENYNDIVLEDF